MSNVDQQRELTRTALAALEPYGFVLAGSGSIREHGLIDRPTEDIDLFTVMDYKGLFPQAVLALRERVERAGWEVTVSRQSDTFARMAMSLPDGQEINVDLGIDWRRFPPARLEIGNVLSRDDAVGNKVAALFSRFEPRDLLDVDAIRQSGTYTDSQLLELAVQSDPGFDLVMFTERLRQVSDIPFRQVQAYLVSEQEFAAVVQRCTQWAQELSELLPPVSDNDEERGRSDATRETIMHTIARASFPESAKRGMKDDIKTVEAPKLRALHYPDRKRRR